MQVARWHSSQLLRAQTPPSPGRGLWKAWRGLLGVSAPHTGFPFVSSPATPPGVHPLCMLYLWLPVFWKVTQTCANWQGYARGIRTRAHVVLIQDQAAKICVAAEQSQRLKELFCVGFTWIENPLKSLNSVLETQRFHTNDIFCAAFISRLTRGLVFMQ